MTAYQEELKKVRVCEEALKLLRDNDVSLKFFISIVFTRHETVIEHQKQEIGKLHSQIDKLKSDIIENRGGDCD